MTSFQAERVSFQETIIALTLARKIRKAKFGFAPNGDTTSAPALVLKILQNIDDGPRETVFGRADYAFAISALDGIYRDAGIERPKGLSSEILRGEIERVRTLPVRRRKRAPHVQTYDERCGYTSAREWTGEYTYDRRGLA